MAGPSLSSLDLNALAQIGLTLFGSLVVGAITVLGVHFTNRSNQRNLQLQLQHDEVKRKREYELSVRRDVYLEAAQTIAAGINAISNFSHLDLEHGDVVKEFDERASSLARVHVVATERTALRLTALMTRLGDVYMRLNTERAVLLALKREMKAQSSRMETFIASRDRHLELMKQLNLSGQRDDQRMDYLQKAFAFDSEKLVQAAIDHDKVLDQLRPRHIEFVKGCLAEQAALRLNLLPLIESVREELQMPIDIALYARAMPRDPAFTEQQLVDLFHAADGSYPDAKPEEVHRSDRSRT